MELVNLSGECELEYQMSRCKACIHGQEGECELADILGEEDFEDEINEDEEIDEEDFEDDDFEDDEDDEDDDFEDDEF
jgi:hypothetical protein